MTGLIIISYLLLGFIITGLSTAIFNVYLNVMRDGTVFVLGTFIIVCWPLALFAMSILGLVIVYRHLKEDLSKYKTLLERVKIKRKNEELEENRRRKEWGAYYAGRAAETAAIEAKTHRVVIEQKRSCGSDYDTVLWGD